MCIKREFVRRMTTTLVLSDSTKASYLFSIDMFLKFRFNKTLETVSVDDLSSISLDDIEEFVEEQFQKKNGEKTILTRLDGIKSFISYLGHKNILDKQGHEIIQEDLKHLTKRLSKRAKNKYTKPDCLNLQEVNQVLSLLANSKNKFKERRLLAMTLMLTGGLRVSELSNLKLSNINIEKSQILLVGTKGDKNRIIYLGKEAVVVLKQYLAVRNSFKYAGEYLFCSARSEQMSIRAFQHEVKDIIDELSINKHISPHKLRRTFATIMSPNTNNFNLKSLMGHEAIATTDIYVNSNEDDLREAIESNPINSLLYDVVINN